MKVLEQIKKTRDYLDYIEEHVLNVEKAWRKLQVLCSRMRFVSDDFVWASIDREVKDHDLSKLSEQEFVQYRKAFHPTARELAENDKYDMSEAWQHHQDKNPHHWQNWAKMIEHYNHPYEWEVHCVCMVVDWMAMAYKFGGSAREYYEKNSDKIEIPDYAVVFINEIFDALGPK